MPTGKAPGPDGFPLEFHKQFWPELCPILMQAINGTLDSNSVPESWSLAVISLLLKKDKDPVNCSFYRPISLLNVDFKIIAKSLARRLETVLPYIVNPDQTGFVKSRYGTDNIRRVLNFIDHLNATMEPAFIVSLDAEKTFDRVEWPFLFAVLEKIELGSNFISLVKLLYSNSMAQVNTNSVV